MKQTKEYLFNDFESKISATLGAEGSATGTSINNLKIRFKYV